MICVDWEMYSKIEPISQEYEELYLKIKKNIELLSLDLKVIK